MKKVRVEREGNMKMINDMNNQIDSQKHNFMAISVILSALTFHQGQTFRSSKDRGWPDGSSPSEASGSSCKEGEKKERLWE